jgi:hypothetical protein
MGWSHTGVTGWPQVIGGPHWKANVGEAVMAAQQTRRSK